jgi:hypothetical protein
VNGIKQQVGVYAVSWEGEDISGKKVGNGVYIYRMEANPMDGSTPFIETGKMVLLR